MKHLRNPHLYNLYRTIGLIAACILLAFMMVSSVMFGIHNYSWAQIIASFTHFDHSNDTIIIQTVRIPRSLIAALVGGSLAVAGALMQALTRNPLASPSIFGINSGAAFAIVLSVSFFHVSSVVQFTWISFLGRP